MVGMKLLSFGPIPLLNHSAVLWRTHQIEPHAGGQQLVLLVLKQVEVSGSIAAPTRSTICCRLRPNVTSMGSDSLNTGLCGGMVVGPE